MKAIEWSPTKHRAPPSSLQKDDALDLVESREQVDPSQTSVFQSLHKAFFHQVSDLFDEDLTAIKCPSTRIVYSYKDEQGKELYRKIRTEPGLNGKEKSFHSEHTNEKVKIIYNLQGCRKVLYRLPEVLKGISESKSIFLVEGEKDADKLALYGLVATTASESIKWPDEFSETIKNADVVILYDMDTTGIQRKELLCQALHTKVKRLRVVDLPGLEYQASHGQDVSDWFAMGHTVSKLLEIASNTPNFSLENCGDKWRFFRKCKPRMIITQFVMH